MNNKRTVALMGVLLVLLTGYLTRPLWEPRWYGNPQRAAAMTVAPPLPGENSVSGLTVHRDEQGRWMASFDYFFTGEPRETELQIGLMTPNGPARTAMPVNMLLGRHPAQRGKQHVTLEIERPDGSEAVTTTQVVARLRAREGMLVRQQVAQTIEWPDWSSWSVQLRLKNKPPEELYKEAVALIDSTLLRNLQEAKLILEYLVGKDAKFDPGYVELARVAMSTNWGPEGLHQAETLLDSALQIRPESLNAKILLGYVYVHQQRFKPAEALFVEAAKSPNNNLWLWVNWGEMLTMQGKPALAEQKFREAVTRPRTHDTYDRARLDAYRRLLKLLEARKDLDGMQSLHQQRLDEFGADGCLGADYARFMLQQRGDTPAAIKLAKQAYDASCAASGSEAGTAASREVLGLAHYMAWSGANGPARQEALNQARVYLPAGPRPLYLLASSERTMVAAKQLVASGEAVDQRDNDKLTALGHALQRQDVATARRLLQLGAKPDALVGYGDMPVALMPVMSTDLAGIRLMRQFGVDYAKLRYQGTTAIDHARQIGDRRLLEALDPKAGTL